ncbi:MAG: hypothetical protein C0404_08560 [Verrucomicrobia bacterium]|nr:hypothetical protein [Verrucomicrobiota bacterium]
MEDPGRNPLLMVFDRRLTVTTDSQEDAKKRPVSALLATVFGVLGFPCLVPLAPFAAIACAHVAFRGIKRSGSDAGRELATIGLVAGYLGILLHVAVFSVVIFPSLRYQFATLGKPMSHEFTLQLEPDSSKAAGKDPAVNRVKEVVSARLKRANIGHKISVQPPDTLVVRVAQGRSVPLEKLREMIVAPGLLEFRLVHKDNGKLTDRLFEKQAAPPGYHIERINYDRLYVRDESTNMPPGDLASFAARDPDYEFMLETCMEKGMRAYRPYYVERRPELAGDTIEDADVGVGYTGAPHVRIRFNPDSAKRFEAVTAAHAPQDQGTSTTPGYRQLAIVFDGVLISAPRIMSRIHGGEAIIEGSTITMADATRLAEILPSGSLPCPVKVVEEKSLR